MIVIISPAKTMDFETPIKISKSNTPLFQNEANYIASECKKLHLSDLEKLMSISKNLAELNYSRFQNFGSENSPKKQAIYTYDGDVYDGFDREHYDQADIDFAENTLRIISGLYGILRPLDLIEPYRLEMGIKLQNKEGKDLYKFWRDKITANLKSEISLSSSKYLINLASNEYSDAIDRDSLGYEVIDINFLETRKGEIKTIPINSKRARGIMANFIIKNKIDNIKDLKEFSLSGYKFSENRSQKYSLSFVKS